MMNFFKPKQPCSSKNNHENHHHNLQTRFSNFVTTSIADRFNFFLKHASSSNSGVLGKKALSEDEIKERFIKVPVHSIRWSDGTVAPIGSRDFERSPVAFYFFSEQDADDSVRKLDGNLYHTSVPLAEIFEVGGGLRLVPDVSQVKNAIEERKKAGFPDECFSGVPVFQSDALRMMTNGSTNRPSKSPRAFFRKEDLEKAIHEEKELSHKGKEKEIIQVTTLEDIIQEMQDCSTSRWNDVVFIPPGGENFEN